MEEGESAWQSLKWSAHLECRAWLASDLPDHAYYIQAPCVVSLAAADTVWWQLVMLSVLGQMLFLGEPAQRADASVVPEHPPYRPLQPRVCCTGIKAPQHREHSTCHQ